MGIEIQDPMNRGAVAIERCYARIRDCVMQWMGSIVRPPSHPVPAQVARARKERDLRRQAGHLGFALTPGNGEAL